MLDLQLPCSKPKKKCIQLKRGNPEMIKLVYPMQKNNNFLKRFVTESNG